MTEASEVRAIASPTRHAIYKVIQSQGEASVREIAAQLGRHPSSLYKQIDQLEEAGVIREVGTRATGKRDARVFSAEKMWIKYEPDDPELIDALNAFVQAELRNAGRKIADAFEEGTAVTSGKGRDTYFASMFGWLTKEELAELNDLLDEVTALMQGKARRPGTTLVATLPMLFPLPLKSRAIEPDPE